jgi:nicotinate-nucleotide adenylyltransferase
MTFAVLGGTFNPVHLGHLNIGREVQAKLGYQRIVFVPANIPAHKSMEMDAGAENRLKMLKLAAAPYPDFLVDDCELRRGGTSYTIDTVRELTRRYTFDGKPGLIIGDDLVEDFKTWRDVDRLVELVDLIIAHRRSPADVEIQYPCRYIDNTLYPISSSQIRQKLCSDQGTDAGNGEMVRDWLPLEVFDYIQRNGLYC